MTQRSSPIPKVLIVSNQPTTGMLWAYSLRQQEINVFFEPVPVRAPESCAEASPDVIVLDINASSHHGTIQLIKTLREETYAPIILLVRNITEENLLEAYSAGVDDCLYKPLSPSIFIAKIRIWLKHSWTVPTETRDALKVGAFYLIPATRTLTVGDGGESVHLTSLELRLLHFLMSRPVHMVSTKELIQVVWGYTADGDYTTLKNLIYRLRRKVEPNPAEPRFIRTVTGGYMLVPDE
jgi:two-component system, OmpR family, KDP operon response regulator KdpE